MNVAELRSAWRETFRSDPPAAFSKDLLARAISYRLQEKVFGGLKPSTARLLRSPAKPGFEPPRAWTDELLNDSSIDFAIIAKREGLAARYSPIPCATRLFVAAHH